MKYRRQYKDPIVYWPITQFLDYAFMNRWDCPIPLFTFGLYVIVLFYTLLLKRSNKATIRTPGLIGFMGLALLIPTLFTSLLQTEYLLIHSIDRYISLIFIFYLIIYYGKRINEKIDTITVMMFNYVLIAFVFYIYKISENNYIVDLMTLRDGLSLFGTNSFIAYIFCFCLLLKTMGKIKEYYFFLIAGSIMSVIYVSRGGFAIAILLIATELLYNKGGIKKFLFILIAAFVAGSILLNNPMVLNRLSSTFEEIQAGTLYSEDNRSMIFAFSYDYLQQPQNIDVLFYGLGLDQFRYINPWNYSDPHNTLVDAIFTAGFLFFLSIFFMMLNITRRSRYKFTYFTFFTYVVFEGVGVVSLKGELSSGYLLFLVSLTYFYLSSPYAQSGNVRLVNTDISKKGDIL
ncbi:hypothetical protein [Sporomusa malonica]|uniref:O-antigen ligase n=1 Tax=Sporomusa malonica TaxID=112901 RepID=A0A1W1YTA3_9FIRM|nr:hypothetical protein [Sporomusa malonica]SMC39332.1 hypothetical protein SAMN04488500_102170 [Sporomusa malonica]